MNKWVSDNVSRWSVCKWTDSSPEALKAQQSLIHTSDFSVLKCFLSNVHTQSHSRGWNSGLSLPKDIWDRTSNLAISRWPTLMKKPTFTVILPQSPTVHTRVQSGGLWGLLCRNWMRNDSCDKFSTSGLQNHYVPDSPTFNHNSHFGKDSKKLCCESEESNAIFYTEPWGQERRQRTRERCDCNPALR